MKQWFSISLFVSLSYSQEIYFTSGNQNPDDSFVMETKFLERMMTWGNLTEWVYVIHIYADEKIRPTR